jgi:hypothetical protein
MFKALTWDQIKRSLGTISKGVEGMTPEQIQKKLEADVEAWLDHRKAEGLKEMEAALKNAEALGKAGVD